MEKKWIVIPDVHGRKFWRDAVKGNEDKRIIFLGDYLDPYGMEGISPEDSYKELLDIISFKKEHPGNVTLLLGNHDLGYLDPNICSVRQDMDNRERNRRLLLDNIDLFDIVAVDQFDGSRILFSHAGIRKRWIKNNRWLFGAEEFNPNVLNELLHDDEGRKDLLFSLADVSIFRGGPDLSGSVVWTDVNEFIYFNDELPGYVQVFGHTLHYGGALSVGKNLWCLDCRKGFEVCPSGDGIELTEL